MSDTLQSGNLWLNGQNSHSNPYLGSSVGQCRGPTTLLLTSIPKLGKSVEVGQPRVY